MKNLLNLGKALNKAEQKSINGGGPSCPWGTCLDLGDASCSAESCGQREEGGDH